jgi:hypothetical protein
MKVLRAINVACLSWLPIFPSPVPPTPFCYPGSPLPRSPLLMPRIIFFQVPYVPGARALGSGRKDRANLSRRPVTAQPRRPVTARPRVLCSCNSSRPDAELQNPPSYVEWSLPPGARPLDRSESYPAHDLSRPNLLSEQLSSLRFGYEAQELGITANSSTTPSAIQNTTLPSGSGVSTHTNALDSTLRARDCRNCPIRYLCERGHVVTARKDTPACLGCPLCRFEQMTPGCNFSRAALSLNALHEIAKDRNGTCLATLYISSRTPVPWRCQSGHTWLASPDNVKSKRSWCPQCAREKKKLSLADMRAMAAGLGGKCLSSEYVSGLQKLRWQCRRGHEFFMAPNNIRREPTSSRKPSWCPLCRTLIPDASKKQQAPRKCRTANIGLELPKSGRLRPR